MGSSEMRTIKFEYCKSIQEKKNTDFCFSRLNLLAKKKKKRREWRGSEASTPRHLTCISLETNKQECLTSILNSVMVKECLVGGWGVEVGAVVSE
jgi:hypothetical protein